MNKPVLFKNLENSKDILYKYKKEKTEEIFRNGKKALKTKIYGLISSE